MEHRQSLLNSASAYFFILLMLFQSCIAYQTTPTTLNSAVDMGSVKIIDNTGAHYKFKSVQLKEGVYYGIGAVYANTEYKSTPEGLIAVLDSTKYEAVYLKDIKKSKIQSIWITIGIAAPVAFVLLVGIAISTL